MFSINKKKNIIGSTIIAIFLSKNIRIDHKKTMASVGNQKLKSAFFH
jgi:hypothetical protein